MYFYNRIQGEVNEKTALSVSLRQEYSKFNANRPIQKYIIT